MKTSPGSEYFNKTSISEPQQTNIFKKNALNRSEINLNDSESQGYAASNNFIICKYELESDYQVVQTGKNKFNPSIFVNKVFKSGIAQKLKSQSLPYNLNKQHFSCRPNQQKSVISKKDKTLINGQCFADNNFKGQSNVNWFKTWPERNIDKFLNIKSGLTCEDADDECCETFNSDLNMSPNLTKLDLHSSLLNSHRYSYMNLNDRNSQFNTFQMLRRELDNKTCEQSYGDQNDNTHKPIPLDDILVNVPLVYSPVTKQLHLVKESNSVGTKTYNNSECHHCCTSSFSCEKNCNSLKLKDCKTDVINKPMDGSFFHSADSSLNDGSPLTQDDSNSLMSLAGCSIPKEVKDKKRSLANFFSRSIFGSKFTWKSIASTSEDQHSDPENCILAPDSPSSLRTFSHENRVASSSALIQLDRPASLPAKDQEEELRHRHEYQEMVEAARKKEIKDAKQKKKQLLLQLKTEEKQALATKVWTKEILPKWEQMRNTRKTRELWWQGVPPCVRGKVWCLTIKDELNLTNSLYDVCVTKAQDKLKSSDAYTDEDVDETDNKEASMQLIQLDINRTFPHLCIFQKGGPFYDMLHCLLAAYVCYRPDVGYVQGMSFIAAVLILNMEAADAFVCFANLLNRPCHMAFFRLDEPIMQAYYATYNDLFKENLPKLYNHFNDTTLSPDLYLLDWIYTIFTKAMNLDLASRVWDVFLRDGEQFLFRTALGILHLCQDTLLKMDFVHGSQFLTKLPDDLSSDLLFKSISAVSMNVGKQSFDDILSFHIQERTRSLS